MFQLDVNLQLTHQLRMDRPLKKKIRNSLMFSSITDFATYDEH